MSSPLQLEPVPRTGRRRTPPGRTLRFPERSPLQGRVLGGDLGALRRACRSCDLEALSSLDDPLALLEASREDPRELAVEALTFVGDRASCARLARLFRRWGRSEPAPRRIHPIGAARPERRPGVPRLGFLSSDLRSHPVSTFLLPLLRGLSGEGLELRCYSTRAAPPGDTVRSELEALCEGLSELEELDDEGAARRIGKDDLDLLVDLNGLTPGRRLGILRRRPAPVQLTWLGYPFSPGLDEVDGFLVDPMLRPLPGTGFREPMLEVPGSFVLMEGFPALPVAPAPCLRRGHVTFGTMNSPHKLTAATVKAWAEVLRELPQTRLLFVRPGVESGPIAERLRRAFAARGVRPERLDFLDNHRAGRSHFECYGEMDLSLDTLPLTGGTTTCDALWMGVPVVSLSGPGMHQRISHSILHSAGCPELSTSSPRQFRDKALQLARSPEALASYRSSLRARLRGSTLFDREGWLRELRAALTRAALGSGAPAHRRRPAGLQIDHRAQEARAHALHSHRR